MIHTPHFYIILPNSSTESWCRWVWSDAEERAVMFLNNTTVQNDRLVKLKNAHFSNELNKHVWLPLKTIWDSTYPVRAEMFDPKQKNYIIFHSGVKVSPHYLRRLKRECNCQTVLYLPDTLAGLNIARNKEEWERYRRHYEIDQVYSFDLEDCKKYGLKFFDFYSVTNVLPAGTPVDTDLFYVGSCRSRERLTMAKAIYGRFKEHARCDFRMIGVGESEIDTGDGIIYNQPMPYSEVVRQNQRSRCILELVNAGQHGNTLRFKEAVCYNVKLLTNNSDALKSKYYNPRWIQYFERPEDIDIDWITNDDTPDFRYEGEFSPLRLLEMIESNCER